MSSFFEKVKAKFSKKRKMAERNGPSGEGAGKGACEEEKEEEDAITKTFCRISGKDSCRDAVERMKEARVSACLVVSNSGILEAIFTERDTVRAVASAVGLAWSVEVCGGFGGRRRSCVLDSAANDDSH